jgi:hypothetical protein
MVENPKVVTEKISLISIKTLKGNIEDVQINSNAYVFEFDSITQIHKEKKLCRFVLNTLIKIVENKKEADVAFYSIEFLFQVENLDDLVDYKEKEKKVNVFMGLGTTIAGIAYGTMRGIIHTRTQGTVLNGIILPIINAQNLLIPKETILPTAKKNKSKLKK